jgi:hypothetical protein
MRFKAKEGEVMRWYNDLPFELVAPIDMPKSSLSPWRRSLQLIARCKKEFNIKVKVVRIHHHEPERTRYGHYHPMGYTYSDEAEMVLCAKDIDTALHEMAHIWANENHTPKWAAKYIRLAQEYMNPEELDAAIRHSASNYRCVKERARRMGIIRPKRKKAKKLFCPGRT